MSKERWDEVRLLFFELAELESEDRTARLDARSKNDPELHEQVRRLLAAHDQTDQLLGSFEDLISQPGFDSPPMPEEHATAPDPHGLIGRTVSHYEVGELLGAGGMGVLYKATDTRLGRTVALKFLPPQWGLDGAFKARFEREARAVAALDHTNICNIHEIGETEQGQLFIAMAYYDGETVKEKIGRGLLTVEDAVDLAEQAASGLAAAHRAGLVHRDIKPANLMVTEEGVLKILDFGLAKTGETALTESGMRLGTPAYMSPEQTRGEDVDARTDLWSLGVVLYEMLTGRRPFRGGGNSAVIHAIRREEPRRPGELREGMPEDVEGLVLRLLSKDPEARYTGAKLLSDELAASAPARAGAISRLKQLVREIHRRFLWQVLGVYVVGGWVTLQVVETLAERAGLPGWLAPLALGLLGVGLPFVLATAIVQEGVATRKTDARGPDELETTPDGTPIEPRPDPEGGAGRRLLTWRNAIVGGVCAFALWGLIAAGWLLLGTRPERAGAASDARIQSIAVLPFRDMSAEGDQEYFSDGIAEELLDELASVTGLRVAARTSAFQFKGTNPDMREVGEKLGVEAVLEGSVRKSGDRVRIAVKLASTEDGFQLWSETYDRQLVDVFAIQEEIAAAIVSALGFGAATNPSPADPATDDRVAAYEFYLLGLNRFKGRQAGREDLQAALSHFQHAAEEDSLFARAHASMALVFSVWPQHDESYPIEEAIRLGKAEAFRAAELDPTLADPHAALCQIATWYEWDWAAAEAHCRRALELRPNDATANQWTAELFGILGRYDEAIAYARRAAELDPLASSPRTTLAWIHAQKGEYEAVIEQSRRSLELDPDAGHAYTVMVLAMLATGRPDGLLKGFLGWAQTPEDTARHAAFVELLSDARNDETKRSRALAMIPELNLMLRPRAFVYMWLDDQESALDVLEQMYRARSPQLPWLLQRHIFKPLHSEPRFVELKRKTGLDRPPAAVE
jgi:TolB-like protein